jgi:hypothetical protein
MFPIIPYALFVFYPAADARGTRVPVPIDNVEFYADSLRTHGGKLAGTGNVRAVFREYGLEIRAERLEYRLLSDKVRLEAPSWRLAAEEKAPAGVRYAIRAGRATLHLEEKSVRAESIVVDVREAEWRLELRGRQGSFPLNPRKSREADRTEKVETRIEIRDLVGDVFRDEGRRGPRGQRTPQLRFRAERATLGLAMDFKPRRLDLRKMQMVELEHGYQATAERGEARMSAKRGIEEIRLSRLRIITGDGTVEGDSVIFRPQGRAAPAGSRGSSED